MTKAGSLYKNAPFLDRAQAAAMARFRQPDLTNLEPKILVVRLPKDKVVAKYWSHALSVEPGHGLQRSLKGRTFIVIDAATTCLLGLFAYKDASKTDSERDPYISWPGEERERKRPMVLEVCRTLTPEPFASLGMMELIVGASRCYEAVNYLSTRGSVEVCALTYNRKPIDETLDNGADLVKVFSDERRTLYMTETRPNGYAFLRGEVDRDALGAPSTFTSMVDTWRPKFRRAVAAARGTVKTWDAERYTLPRLLLSHDGHDGAETD